jgi:hypothetical protein
MAHVPEVLRLSGNCGSHTLYTLKQIADECIRYSNTLLMSLNNRIYSRENQSSHNAGLMVSDRVLATAATTIHFAETETGLGFQAPTEESSQLCNTLTVDLVQGKGDNASVDWSVVSAIFRHKCPLSEWYASPFSPALGMVMMTSNDGRHVTVVSPPKGGEYWSGHYNINRKLYPVSCGICK